VISVPAIAIVMVSVLLLLASGWWTDNAYRRFDQIPAHYDIRGNATRLTPRRPMAWALPAGFSIFLVGFALAIGFIPPEMQNGDPSAAIIASSLIMLAAQGIILWLLRRWALGQK
jgi:hypothetical protein